jgi:DNA invertase Pin-like site-specific DNA recombinase
MPQKAESARVFADAAIGRNSDEVAAEIASRAARTARQPRVLFDRENLTPLCPQGEDRICTDHDPTGTNRLRHGLDQALAAVRAGDTLVVAKLDRLARSVPDARRIADELMKRGVKLQLASIGHDPTDPMGKMFFNILATFAEFESDLIRMPTREGMTVAKAKGKLKGKQPKLLPMQTRELRRTFDTGDYSISDLSDVFKVSRPTIYRPLARQRSASGPSINGKPASHN